MLATLLTPGESSATSVTLSISPTRCHQGRSTSTTATLRIGDDSYLAHRCVRRTSSPIRPPPEMAPLIRDSTWTTTYGSRGRRMARSTLRSSDKMMSSLVIRRHRMMMTFGPTMGVLASVSMAITVAAPTSSMQGCVPDARMPSCQSDPTHKPSNTRPCRQ
jgi:hypothetical protein